MKSKTVGSALIVLRGDRRSLPCGERGVTYGAVASRCRPEIRVTLSVSYTAVKTNKTTMTKANHGSLPFSDL